MRAVRPALLWTLATVSLAFLAWIAFTGELTFQELAVGAACALFCGTGSVLTWKAMDLPVAFQLGDVLQIWRAPWNALQDAGVITWALMLDLLRIRRAGSHFRAIPYAEHGGRRGRMRHVLAVACTSVTPNTIVIGIDDRQGLMLLHQIVRCEVSPMTRRLGARP